MQLNDKQTVKNALALAASVLLGTGITTAKNTDIESSLLYYSESKRVSAAEGAVAMNHEINEEQNLRVKLTFDGLTGASPNGAAPSKRVQTFTRPSGNGSYNVAAGETPLDDTFRDTRVAASGSYSRKVGRLYNYVLGGNFSTEHDYFSFVINTGISRDFNNKNTNFSLSGSYSYDKVKPEGGIPIPFASMPTVNSPLPRIGSDDNKKTLDVLAGITQTIDRNTLFRANYSHSRATGYLTDPYKILSVVQDESAVDPGEPVDFIYENRPDKRTKQAVYPQIRRYIKGGALDLSYRFFWDDWGINSHTVNLFYNWPLRNGHALVPHFRWYHQTASDYYVPTLIANNPLPEFASADYRLNKMTAITAGIQYVLPLAGNNKIKIGAEYYSQFGDKSPPGVVGSQFNYELFPTLKSLMIRIGYDFVLK